ncbi:MAG: cell envelope biogenesis protein TolA [Rhodoblastus sp.]
MIYVILQYWIYVALAFVLGLFVGWATCTGADSRHERSNWLPWTIAAFLVGLFLAAFKWVPGLPGHLLELALLLFAAYVLGCLTGCGCRRISGDDAHPDAGGADDSHGAGSGHGAGGGHAAGSASGSAGGAHAQDASPAHPSDGSLHAPASESAAGAKSPVSPQASSASQASSATASPQAPAGAAPPAAGATAAGGAVSSGAGAHAGQEFASQPSASQSSASQTPAVQTPSGSTAASATPVTAPSASPDDLNGGQGATAAGDLRDSMTDGQRSILAAREKLALQRKKAAPPPQAASAPQAAPAPIEAAAPAAPSIAPAASSVTPAATSALAPRAGMTDGQRSIIAARRKMAEKVARAAQGGEAANDDGRPGPDAPPHAAADDLKLIKGVGVKNEAALNELGVRRFAQIADWNADDETWAGRSIRFPGRIEREHWVAQAKLLAAGIDTPHAIAVKSGALRIDDSADAPLSEVDVADLVASLPQQAPKVADEAAYAGARPLGLAAPKSGKNDNLKLIKGIGAQNEERLHKLGVWHFDQIAAWSSENVKWIGSYLAFPGRIDREKWIDQAACLARGEMTGFARRVEAGDVPTSIGAGVEAGLTRRAR